MSEGTIDEAPEKRPISLYEFYALAIERLLGNAPWELERAVSPYHESFLTEQRCLGLSILLLLGEDLVPPELIAEKGMPGFEDQTRSSINQAVFLRAFKHYFEAKNLNRVRADMAFERMQSYLKDSREANAKGQNPLEAMLLTVTKRVPPQDDAQKQQYQVRVGKIFDYIQGLVEKGILKRYDVTH